MLPRPANRFPLQEIVGHVPAARVGRSPIHVPVSGAEANAQHAGHGPALVIRKQEIGLVCLQERGPHIAVVIKRPDEKVIPRGRFGVKRVEGGQVFGAPLPDNDATAASQTDVVARFCFHARQLLFLGREDIQQGRIAELDLLVRWKPPSSLEHSDHLLTGRRHIGIYLHEGTPLPASGLLNRGQRLFEQRGVIVVGKRPLWHVPHAPPRAPDWPAQDLRGSDGLSGATQHKP